MTTPTGRTGTPAPRPNPRSRPVGEPGPTRRRLRRGLAVLAAGVTATTTAGLIAAPAGAATPGARTAPAALTETIAQVAPVPGTRADWALGRNNAGKTVVWQYSGSSWRTVSVATSTTTQLVGVAAGSAARAWLVGTTDTSKGTSSVIEAWSGSSFKTEKSASVADGTLTGITASSASNAWAYGSVYNASTGDKVLLQHWTGHSWQRASTSGIPAGTQITDITTASGSTWALGDQSGENGTTYLFLEWTGSKWKSTPYPLSKVQYLEVYGIAAASSTSAFATGYEPSGNTDKAFALHWNGHTWASVSVPKGLLLESVGAGYGKAWVGGYRSTGELDAVAVILSWTGHSFATDHLASISDKFSAVSSIAVNSATDAVAVGERGPNGCQAGSILVERLSGSTWSRGAATLPQTMNGIGPHC